jgi:hypothetical protein
MIRENLVPQVPDIISQPAHLSGNLVCKGYGNTLRSTFTHSDTSVNQDLVPGSRPEFIEQGFILKLPPEPDEHLVIKNTQNRKPGGISSSNLESIKIVEGEIDFS